MSDREKIKAGMDQMGFEMLDNGNMELPSSKPATYVFTEPATYDPDAFESELESHDFTTFDEVTGQKDSGEFYYYADVQTDHYKRLTVKVWQLRANIYPTEDGIDTYEFSRIVHAIENAFQAELEHETDE